MKKIFIAALFVLCGVGGYAQTFKITGKVADKQNVPVNFAEVLLVQNDSVCGYELTDESGNFAVNAKAGLYSMLVKQLGDTLYSQTLNLTQNIDLQTIAVQQTKELQEVVVVAQKKLIERRADRTVFNVENLPNADGGNVMDILRITPNVIVSNDNIAIAGKGSVSMMINERFVQLSGAELTSFLKTLQANDVQSIEVITTPPAKYEAEGNSGMINIVLKKTPQNTWKSTVFGSYTQAKYGSGEIGGNFNYRKNRLSFYANLSYSKDKSNGEDYSVSIYPDLKWQSSILSIYKSNPVNVRTGFDVNITDNWIVGAGYMGNYGDSKSNNIGKADILSNIDNTQAALINSEGNGKHYWNTNSANIHSIVTLDTLGRKINFDFDFLNYNTNSDNDYSSTVSNSQVEAIANGFESKNQILDRKITNYSAKIDVEHPFAKFNLNYGAKLSFTKTNNDVATSDLSDGIFVPNPAQTNNFLYRENRQAIYASASMNFGKNNQWQAQIGLRGENTQWEGRSVTLDSVNKNAYFKIFPTAFLSFTPSEKNIFYAEYGRRISRPSFNELNPFRWYSNPYYYTEGNPELKPTITDNIMLSYIYNNIFQTGLFFGNDTESRGQVIIIDNDSYTQAIKRLNYFSNYNVGAFIGYIFTKLKWWNCQTGLNFWFEHSDSKIYPITPKSTEGYSGDFQTINIFYFDKNQNFSTGFDFIYRPNSMSTEMIYRYKQTYLNAFVKMLFLNKQLSLTLNLNNLLKEYDFNNKRESNGNVIFTKGYGSPLSARLSVSYTFGSRNINVQQRQVSNEDEKERL